MNKLILLMGMVVLVSIQTVYAKSPPAGTGKADVPANILFLLDVSGSMTSSIPGVYQEITDLAVDSEGHHWFLSTPENFVRRVDHSNPELLAVLGTFGEAGSGDKHLQNPQRITIKKDPDDKKEKVYISDKDNNRVQKYKIESGTELLSLEKSFPVLEPEGLDVDSEGNIYVYSAADKVLIKLDKDGTELTRWTSGPALSLSVYEGPKKPPSPNDDFIYSVGGPGTAHRVKQFDLDGNLIADEAAKWGFTPDVVATPDGVYTVAAQETPGAYGYDSDDRKVTRLTHDLQFVKDIGSYGSGNYYWKDVRAIGTNPSTGRIWIGDYRLNNVKLYSPTLVFYKELGARITRIDAARIVIKKLVSDPDLVKGANFGLETWATTSETKIAVPVDVDGASKIFKFMDTVTAPGWATDLDPAMALARDYLRGSQSPIDKSASCQKTFLIVLSDGYWSDRTSSSIAKDLVAKNGIKTFVIGMFTSGNSNYIKLSKAGGTYPDSPLYTQNWMHLYTTLASYIRQAIASRLTFTTPFVMPGVSGDDHIFQSTFTYKTNHQWEGKLQKFKIKPDGGIGSLVWEAGSRLNDKSASSRKIWTVGIPQGMNNFTLSNKAKLQDLMWENSGENPTDAEVENLIKFVRGIDAYDENADTKTNDERWKLGDIYHSQIAVVGAPTADTSDDPADNNTEAYYRHLNGYITFKKLHEKRNAAVYVGANDGMLHAFDSTSGQELWAFIPPAMLPKFRNMRATSPNESVSIYGVDGSPVIKDVFYQNKWTTMLIAGMGLGGKSYFALDVTYRDNPRFLFAFSNDPTEKKTYHWNSAGVRTTHKYSGINTNYNYSKLGHALSIPTIVLARIKGAPKWVGAIGAGFNAGVDTNYASAIYIIDLENEGEVLKKLDLTDNPGGYANAFPSQLTAITPDTTGFANYSGAMLYGVDLEAKEHKFNLTNDGIVYSHSKIFDGQGTTTNGQSSYFSVTPSIGTDGKLWVYFGTGDQQKLQHMSPTIKNRIFGIRDSNFPRFKTVPTDMIGKLKNVSGGGSVCPSATDSGWYINLTTNEKVTGKIAIHDRTLYVSRYTPNNAQVCNPGTNLLSEIGYGCGKSQKETKLGNGILTGAVVFKGNIYIGISGVAGDAGGSPATGYTQHGNIIVGKPANSSDSGGAVNQESWREIF